MELSRRNFMSASAAAVVTAGTTVRGRAFAANERIGMLVVGVNGQGNSHIRGFAGSDNAEVVALCDPDERILERRAAEVKEATGKEPSTYADLRDALADPRVDAVSIATPHHWHALAAIWAAQAGKDVYVEKPSSYDVFEGRQLIAAAEKYDRIIQHGTQRRSDRRWLRDIPLLQSGEIIGPLYMARCLGYKHGNRGPLGFHDDRRPPRNLDWELWQGPAARQPFNPAYHPYNWHWFWHYGNGEIGNQGVHQMDVGIWGINKGMPRTVFSAGGRYTYEDMAETPNTNVATFTYDDGTMLVFEVRNRWTHREAGMEIDGKFFRGVDVGNMFYGEEGYYVEGAGFFDTNDRLIPLEEDKYPTPESAGPLENFLAAVKAHNPALIHGDMVDAHIGNTHCHLANIAYRVGQSLEFDADTETFKQEEANHLLAREYAEGFEVPKLA